MQPTELSNKEKELAMIEMQEINNKNNELYDSLPKCKFALRHAHFYSLFNIHS